MAAIETINLTKRFGDHTAVDALNLTVEEGSIHGFVGPNGAGKTTTMRMLIGLISPTAGEVHICGNPAGTLAANARVGYAPQEPTFYRTMSGLDYLRFMGQAAGLNGTEATERAHQLLAWLDLEDAFDRRTADYSGGMRRKLSLAQAMIHEPDVLILDEPTATLDPAGRLSIIDALQELTAEGMTVFVSSHVLAELEKFIDTVTILYDGRHLKTGTVADLRTTFGSEMFAIESSANETLGDHLAACASVARVHFDDDGTLRVMTDDPGAFKDALVEILAEADIRLDAFSPEGGLEQAFVDLVAQDGLDDDAQTAGGA